MESVENGVLVMKLMYWKSPTFAW